MKQLVSVIFIFSIIYNGISQSVNSDFSYENFELEVLKYQPSQIDISDQDYAYGVMILDAMKKDVDNDPDNFNCADYFNILSSFVTLNEQRNNIQLAFEKLKTTKGSCAYFLSERMFKSSKFDIIRNEINGQTLACSNHTSEPIKFDLMEYASKHKLDYELLQEISKINDLDSKYRKNENIDWSKQNSLDKRNQQHIDALYDTYNQYLGIALVGEKFNHVMWSVIQHSDVATMERYIPEIQKAVAENELAVGPFKMLIDRYYGLKYGYQVFGSQSGFGFKLADEVTRKEIELKYNIE